MELPDRSRPSIPRWRCGIKAFRPEQRGERERTQSLGGPTEKYPSGLALSQILTEFRRGTHELGTGNCFVQIQ